MNKICRAISGAGLFIGGILSGSKVEAFSMIRVYANRSYASPSSADILFFILTIIAIASGVSLMVSSFFNKEPIHYIQDLTKDRNNTGGTEG